MVFKLTSTQFLELQTLRNTFPTEPTLGNGYDYWEMYEKVLEYLDLYEQTNTLSQNEITTKLWIEGAMGVNRNNTAESQFIRNYNNMQAQWRYGETVSDAQMDQVSDEIAILVIDNILNNNSDPTISDLPSIGDIAEHDAGPAAERLFNNDPTPGGWAGNPLFLFLGHDAAFQNNIIGEAGNAYDLLAMLKGLGINFFSANFYSQFINAVQVTYSAGSASTVAGAVADASDFLEEVYGDDVSLLTAATFYDVQIGREGEVTDNIIADEDSEFIHAGAGDDYIKGSLTGGVDFDIIDGGDGTDELDFSFVDADIELESGTEGYTNFNLEIDRANVGSLFSTSYAYNIEKLYLGSGEDEVDITLNAGSTLERLDTNQGDDEVEIALTPNTSFKRLDTGTGDDEVEMTGAGVAPGALEVRLGAGDDTLLAGTAGMVVYGGAGEDTFYHSGRNFLIADAEIDDRVSYWGLWDLTGGIRWKGSESPWARGIVGERYGLKSAAFNVLAANDNVGISQPAKLNKVA